MEVDRQSLKTSIYFLLDNRESATIVEYIAGKYGLAINPAKTLAQNAQSLINYLMNFTGSLEDESPQTLAANKLIARQNNIQFKEGLNLKAYMGKWYNAASFPQAFDRGLAWKTADYELLPSNSSLPVIKVINTGHNEDGSIKAVIPGTAQIVDPKNLAALYVSFPTGQPQTEENPTANYLIHDTDYTNYAVVGSYDKLDLYLLVRQRPISRNLYNRLVDYASRLGYDVSKLAEDYGAIQ